MNWRTMLPGNDLIICGNLVFVPNRAQTYSINGFKRGGSREFTETPEIHSQLLGQRLLQLLATILDPITKEKKKENIKLMLKCIFIKLNK